MKKLVRTIALQPLRDTMAALEPIVLVKSPAKALAPPLIALVIIWTIYVPLHELLHAAGCVITGGEFDELQISRRYGGAIFAKMFDFVVSESNYAGRLSQFDVKCSDFCYFWTVFLPFVPTVLLGVPLMKLARRRRRPIMFAAGVVVGLAPFYQLPGDYMELGSITVTRVVTLFTGPDFAAEGQGFSTAERPEEEESQPENEVRANMGAEPKVAPASSADTAGDACPLPAFAGIRSDDAFLLIADLFKSPRSRGLTSAGQIVGGVVVMLLSMACALGLAILTYWVGHLFSIGVLRMQPPAPAVRPGRDRHAPRAGAERAGRRKSGEKNEDGGGA